MPASDDEMPYVRACVSPRYVGTVGEGSLLFYLWVGGSLDLGLFSSASLRP